MNSPAMSAPLLKRALPRHITYKYYAPKGIWEDYRMNSEKFDLQMPYDASEFFINLIETGC
jgi:hypothetical protein